MAQTAPTIDRLLSLVPDAPDHVIELLRAHPTLAPQQDAHGYSLLHAAISYAHRNLLQTLISEFNLDPNTTDEDSETCLFNAEDTASAQAALSAGVDPSLRNSDGQTAAEKLADEDEAPLVAAFIREATGAPAPTPNAAPTAPNGTLEPSATHPPPPLPDGVQVNLGTMAPEDAGGEPDPEFRRRIEELAARGDFEGEEGQRELRRLVEEAIEGLIEEGGTNGGPPAARRARMG